MPLLSRPASQSIVPLTALRPGATARLHGADIDAACRARLRSLGLTDTCTLRLCKQGEPCIVQVRSTRIGLSRSVAHGLFVIPDPTGQD